MLVSIAPSYSFKEGFATLMGHYAVLYSLHRDSGCTPTIINFSFNEPSCMEFFNQFEEKILYPENVFLNLNRYFVSMSDKEAMEKGSWISTNFCGMSYEQILQNIKQIKNTINKNVLVNWTLSLSMINKYKDDIINHLFEFDNDLVNNTKNLLPTTTKQIVGICVRNQYKKFVCPHHQLSMDFYIEAMNQFDINNTKFLIFSDFIDEAKIDFKPHEIKYDIEYTKPMPSAVGLCLMSLCDHIICANSSFSVWASLLNKNRNKKIVCSTKWIDESKDSILAHILNYKWYPSEWCAIDI